MPTWVGHGRVETLAIHGPPVQSVAHPEGRPRAVRQQSNRKGWPGHEPNPKARRDPKGPQDENICLWDPCVSRTPRGKQNQTD